MTALVCGCSAGETTSPLGVELALELPGGMSLTLLSYTVLSSQRVPLIVGTKSVSDPNAPLLLELWLPPGAGDVAEIAATTSSGADCRGLSAPFDVVAGQPISVAVPLVCPSAQTESNHCPLVTLAVPQPTEAVAPAGTISLAATATDPDATDLPSFVWSATAGAFSAPNAAATVYTCTTAGAQSLILTVGDHDATGCIETLVLPVACLASDGEAPASDGGSSTLDDGAPPLEGGAPASPDGASAGSPAPSSNAR